MAHTVFICHSARDKQVADAACAALEARRIPCWIAPRDILGGDEWGKSIVDAINDCRIVLLIFSAHANTSPQVRREVERAVSKAKIIVPFRIEDVLPSDAMEYALGNTHWLDAISPPVETHLAALADTIARILQRTQPVSPVFTNHPPRNETPHAVPAYAAPTPSAPPAAPSVLVATVSPTQSNRLKLGVAAAVLLLAIGGFFLWRTLSARSPAQSPTVTFPPPNANPTALAPASSLVAAPPEKATTNATAAKPASNQTAAQPLAKSASPPASSAAEEFKRGKALFEANNNEEARSLLEQSCNGGVPNACSFVGTMFKYGEGGSPNITHALALYRKACNEGDGDGCEELGGEYVLGVSVTRDVTQAAALFRKACDVKISACSELGYLYLNGVGGTGIDLPKALAVFRKACDKGDEDACRGLGVMYEDGKGVPQDIGQAIFFYRKSCKGGDGDACDALKRLQP